MTGIRNIARELPIVIGGAGPAGTVTAIGLERAGVAVRVLEARGPLATRARNIFLRPQAREITRDIAGFDPGRESTISGIENRLREVAKREGVQIAYNHKIVGVKDFADHVDVMVQREGSDAIETISAKVFVDASGGRIPATNTGDFERVAIGKSHVYVTAQYDSPARFDRVYGVFDRHTKEGMMITGVDDNKGFIAYFDKPPGEGVVDEDATIARYNMIAGKLEFGEPVSPPQVFDAQQHISKSVASGHILKIGDSAGNSDPYIGAGVAAALVDARTAIQILSKPGLSEHSSRSAADDVIRGHEALSSQAATMIKLRNLAFRTLPRGDFDGNLKPADLGDSLPLEVVAQVLTNRNIPT